MHGADDLVVAGAAAQVARQPVADFALAGIGLAFEQRLGRDDEAGRAEAALQRPVLEELALDRMQFAALGNALDRCDRAALGLGGEHQAGADHLAVQHHGAGPAIARAAAFLRASQAKLEAQCVEQGFAWIGEELYLIAIDRCRNENLAHAMAPARSRAIVATRLASTPAMATRYSMVPRLSAIGLQAASHRLGHSFERAIVELAAHQRRAGCFDQQHGRRHRAHRNPRQSAGSTSIEHQSRAAADHGDIHFGARDRAQVGVAAAFRPGGSLISTTNSPGASEVLPGPVVTASTATSRRPLGPAIAASRSRRDQRRNRVRRRGGVAQVSGHGRAVAHLHRADQIGRLDHAGPGRSELLVILERGARRRRADDEHAALLADTAHPGDALDIDNRRGR